MWDGCGCHVGQGRFSQACDLFPGFFYQCRLHISSKDRHTYSALVQAVCIVWDIVSVHCVCSHTRMPTERQIKTKCFPILLYIYIYKFTVLYFYHRQASRDKKELQMAIRTHKERNSTLSRLNSELNQELQEVMEQRIALEIQLEHLRPFSS